MGVSIEASRCRLRVIDEPAFSRYGRVTPAESVSCSDGALVYQHFGVGDFDWLQLEQIWQRPLPDGFVSERRRILIPIVVDEAVRPIVEHNLPLRASLPIVRNSFRLAEWTHGRLCLVRTNPVAETLSTCRNCEWLF